MMKKILPSILRLFQRKSFRYAIGIPAAFFILINYIVLPLYVNHHATLVVPAVVGEDLAQAKQALDSVGLEPVEAETRPDPMYPTGTVAMQNPGAESVVKQGRRVYLTVSGGEIQVTVPLLRGRTTREAKFALERFGLKLGGIGYVSSESYPENTIVDQSAAPDGRVIKGTRVNVTVSRGRTASDTTAPSLTGRTVGEAEKILAQAGLNIGIISYQPNYALLPNTVVEQFPRAGDPVHQGQAIDLFVVKAGRPAEEIQSPR